MVPETKRKTFKIHFIFQFPASEKEWLKIAAEFEDKWQFPHCLGAVDGKHIKIIIPGGSGSFFWNYKGSNSLVLMAIVNANYEFIYCDIGTNGRISDGGVLENTRFYEKLVAGRLQLPQPRCPQNSTIELPYVFVGDEAFALRRDFLKPFAQRDLIPERKVFNYRLSRARRIVENVFGIMASRFRIFHTEINLRLDRIENVVLACCVLHNYLRRRSPSYWSPQPLLSNEEITEAHTEQADNIFIPLQRGFNRNYGQQDKEVRDIFMQFFNNEGRVEWQDQMIV